MALQRLRTARVGRIATIRPDGRPHVIPFVFVVARAGPQIRAYWIVDDKPKVSPRLQRLRNIEVNPACEFVVDGYDEHWDRLWWVRASGNARVVTSLGERERAVQLLRSKYPHYHDLAETVVVAIDIEDVTGWDGAAD